MEKTYLIQVKGVKESLKDFAEAYKKLESGKKIKPVEKLTFPDVETFRKFLTKRRLELLKTIRNKKVKSIKDLSKMTKRDYKSVNTDLDILKKMDLVSLEKENNKVKPHSNYDKINIEISLEA